MSNGEEIFPEEELSQLQDLASFLRARGYKVPEILGVDSSVAEVPQASTVPVAMKAMPMQHIHGARLALTAFASPARTIPKPPCTWWGFSFLSPIVLDPKYQKALDELLAWADRHKIFERRGESGLKPWAETEGALQDFLREAKLKTANGEELALLYGNANPNLKSVDAIAVNKTTGEVLVFDAKNYAAPRGVPRSELDALQQAHLGQRPIIRQRVDKAINAARAAGGDLLQGMTPAARNAMFANLRKGSFTRVIALDGLATRIPSSLLKKGYIAYYMNKRAGGNLPALRDLLEDMVNNPDQWRRRLNLGKRGLSAAVRKSLGRLVTRLNFVLQARDIIAGGAAFVITQWYCGDTAAALDAAGEEYLGVRPSEASRAGLDLINDAMEALHAGEKSGPAKYFMGKGKAINQLTPDDILTEAEALEGMPGGKELLTTARQAKALEQYAQIMTELEGELQDVADEGFVSKESEAELEALRKTILEEVATSTSGVPSDRRVKELGGQALKDYEFEEGIVELEKGLYKDAKEAYEEAARKRDPDLLQKKINMDVHKDRYESALRSLKAIWDQAP